MEDQREKLVIEENAVYELDLECVRQREKEREERRKRAGKGKGDPK